MSPLGSFWKKGCKVHIYRGSKEIILIHKKGGVLATSKDSLDFQNNVMSYFFSIQLQYDDMISKKRKQFEALIKLNKSEKIKKDSLHTVWEFLKGDNVSFE